MKLLPGSIPTGDTEPLDETDEKLERWLRCAACGHRVTTETARIQVNGTHEHTFMNPAGIRFVVACFASAQCTPEGSRSSVWTWFPGYAWQVELCGGCQSHLGWSFHGATAASFYGLIVDRLVC